MSDDTKTGTGVSPSMTLSPTHVVDALYRERDAAIASAQTAESALDEARRERDAALAQLDEGPGNDEYNARVRERDAARDETWSLGTALEEARAEVSTLKAALGRLREAAVVTRPATVRRRKCLLCDSVVLYDDPLVHGSVWTPDERPCPIGLTDADLGRTAAAKEEP